MYPNDVHRLGWQQGEVEDLIFRRQMMQRAGFTADSHRITKMIQKQCQNQFWSQFCSTVTYLLGDEALVISGL